MQGTPEFYKLRALGSVQFFLEQSLAHLQTENFALLRADQ